LLSQHLREKGFQFLSLSLVSCSLSGQIELSPVFRSLRVIELSDNALSGPLLFLNNSWELVQVRLSSNLFSGSLPLSLRCGHSIADLDLSDNDLVGPILEFDFGFALNLTDIDLSSNKLQGRLPVLVNKTRLRKMILSNNLLSGSIPDFENVPILNRIVLSSNNLSSSIPSRQICLFCFV
jgi:Leucine-rich repeat (LRR) protein